MNEDQFKAAFGTAQRVAVLRAQILWAKLRLWLQKTWGSLSIQQRAEFIVQVVILGLQHGLQARNRRGWQRAWGH